jgi:hypothetical protein
MRMPNEQVKMVMAVLLPRWNPGAHSTCGAMFWFWLGAVLVNSTLAERAKSMQSLWIFNPSILFYKNSNLTIFYCGI